MFATVIGNPFEDKHTRIHIDAHVVKSLLAEGQEALPNEYSALLAGYRSTIVSAVAGTACEYSRQAFAWTGPEFFASLSQIQQQGLTWLGVVHTHPRSPAVPSPRDIRGWHYPALSYWILSFAASEPELCLYQWVDGAFVKREYCIV